MQRVSMRRARALLALLLALLCFGAQWAGAAQSIAWGSQGDDVIAVQRKLKQWGYYDGAVDGVFAQDTYNAVVRFQQKNRLSADGVVGQATAAAMGIQLGAATDQAVPVSGTAPARYNCWRG